VSKSHRYASPLSLCSDLSSVGLLVLYVMFSPCVHIAMHISVI
jgi:hypothetical protein